MNEGRKDNKEERKEGRKDNKKERREGRQDTKKGGKKGRIPRKEGRGGQQGKQGRNVQIGGVFEGRG